MPLCSPWSRPCEQPIKHAPATWNERLSALRSFAAYAIRNEWITADPALYLVFADTQRGDLKVRTGRHEKTPAA